MLTLSAVGGVACFVGYLLSDLYWVVLGCAFVGGGMANPLYSLLIAYTNDYLELDDMAAASGGLLFMNGVGAVFGPILTGGVMTLLGPGAFWMFLAALMVALSAYAAYRMSQRAAVEVDQPVTMQAFTQEATAVAVETAQEYFAEGLDETPNSA